MSTLHRAARPIVLVVALLATGCIDIPGFPEPAHTVAEHPPDAMEVAVMIGTFNEYTGGWLSFDELVWTQGPIQGASGSWVTGFTRHYFGQTRVYVQMPCAPAEPREECHEIELWETALAHELMHVYLNHDLLAFRLDNSSDHDEPEWALIDDIVALMGAKVQALRAEKAGP